MQSILEEIYYGNRGNAESIDLGKAYRKAQSKGCDLFEKMEKGLSEKKKKLLTKLFWSGAEQEAEAIKSAYKEGFKIGLLLAFECLADL